MESRISKEKFVKIIKMLKRKDEAECRMNDILSEYDDVYCDGIIPIDSTASIVVELLEMLLNLNVDKNYGSTLSWWMYEQDFGESFTVGALTYTDKDGNEVAPDLSTPEQLYDYLVSEGSENA